MLRRGCVFYPSSVDLRAGGLTWLRGYAICRRIMRDARLIGAQHHEDTESQKARALCRIDDLP